MKNCILLLTVSAMLACGSAGAQDTERSGRGDVRAVWQKALADYKAKDPKGYAELMKLRETDRDAFRARVGERVRRTMRGDGPDRKPAAADRTGFTVPDSVTVARDIVYATYGQRKVMLDMYLPKQPPAGKLPCIIVIHGGGWRSGDKGRLARFAAAFAARGFAAACVGYRLRPEVDIPQCVEDVKAATRWVRANAGKYNINPDRLGACGGSAGAHLAAMLGTSFKAKQLEGKGGNEGVSSRVHAVVAMATPSDFTRFGRAFQGDGKTARLISPATHVDADSAAFLLIHCKGDRVVPYSQSTLLLEKLQAAKVPAALTAVEGRSHAFWNGKGPDAIKALADAVAFFTRTLKAPPAKTSGK